MLSERKYSETCLEQSLGLPILAVIEDDSFVQDRNERER